MFVKFKILILFMLAALLGEAAAKTNLPLPRFYSLRAAKVNLRVGPGSEYPIDWVIRYPNLPVQVVAEYETWRQIKDCEGTTGWVHQSMLSGKRYILVKQDLCLLMSSPERDARPVAKVKAGVVCKLKKCKAGYCQVQAGKVTGWLPNKAIWGVDEKDWRSDKGYFSSPGN